MTSKQRSGPCIYTVPNGLCTGSFPLHPKEHYLPAGLGNFKNDTGLKNYTGVPDSSGYHGSHKFPPNAARVGIRKPSEFDGTSENPVLSSRKFGTLLT